MTVLAIMKNGVFFSFLLLTVSFFCSCDNELKQPIKANEVSPWCIIGFDSLDRNPTQRIALLKEMGFSKYGYNRGKGDLSQMKTEFNLARENDIEITSVFLWLNAKRDSIGKLSLSNQELLNNLADVEYKPAIWLSFSDNFFEGLSQEASVNLSVEMIQFVKLKADELGCKLALYNHHGWFGSPYNQVEILEVLKQDSISMVYNFHHAHEYVDEFPQIVKLIKPYLSFVNLNGVKEDGPQILTLGEGDYEYDMIQSLINEGFNGPWGILGHIKTEDVQVVLERNVNGLELINRKLSKSKVNE